MPDLLRFHASLLGQIPDFQGCAVINASGEETGFIHRSNKFHDFLKKRGYTLTESATDMRTGLVTTVCIDKQRNTVERVAGASFCPSVVVAGLAAFVKNGRLEMPSLTVLHDLDSPSLAARFPWLSEAIRFTNKCLRFADVSVQGRVSYPLSVEVKKAWNEFYKTSGSIWLSAPSFDIDWKEELPASAPAEKQEMRPLEVVKMMKGHPKNDASTDLSFRESRLIMSFRPM